MMPPSHRADLYHQLAVLLAAGLPWNNALDRLMTSATASGRLKKAVTELRDLTASSEAPTDRLNLPANPLLPLWEKSLLAAGQRTGQVVAAAQTLAREAEARQEARRRLWRSCGYPLLVAHLAIFLLSVPTALLGGGVGVFLLTVGHLLGLLWGTIGGCCAIFFWLVRRARLAPGAETVLSLVPGFGPYWRRSSAARWAGVLVWYFQAGGGILEGLPLAGEAAGSAGAERVSRRMGEGLRRGRSLAEAAEDERWLPEEVRQSLWLGEESGHLVGEMQRAIDRLHQQAEEHLAAWVRWVPRWLYVGVVVFTAWRILDWATGYYRTVESLLGGG